MSDSYSKYKRFMPIAQAFAAMSKYPRTKVGALILGPGYEVRASGWNGAPRGSKADEDGRLADRATSLPWICHAESNAIANAARAGTSVEGATMVVTHMPCMNCAKLIVQAGISAVICPKPEGAFASAWAEENALARALFAECGVNLVECDTTGV